MTDVRRIFKISNADEQQFAWRFDPIADFEVGSRGALVSAYMEHYGDSLVNRLKAAIVANIRARSAAWADQSSLFD
jgi:hypothetical protein